MQLPTFLTVKKVSVSVGLGGSEAGKTLAVLGLAFKPETDDIRDAPALTIISTLLEHGAVVRAHDPAAMREAAKVLADVKYCANAYEACEGADALILMTEWNEYRALDLDRIKTLLNEPIFIDLRNVYPADAVREKGFRYHSVGRGVAV